MKIKYFILAMVIGVTLAGCYTIGSKETAVSFQSSTQGVQFELVDGNGNVIASGQTPYVVELKAKSFNGARYLHFTDRDGNEVSQAVKGRFFFKPWWLLGSIPSGGFIIDLATGSFWKLPDVVNLENISYNPDTDIKFIIATMDDVLPESRQYLVPINVTATPENED
jgi:hypothetical protein